MQRQGLLSVPIIATRVGLICTTRSSGTKPPADVHSPQKKDTRKNPQQAPQFKQGLCSDMIRRRGGKFIVIGRKPAAILCFASALRRGHLQKYRVSDRRLIPRVGRSKS
jgi:hypothetical protein